jgi:hypothetical protein
MISIKLFVTQFHVLENISNNVYKNDKFVTGIVNRIKLIILHWSL